MGILGGAGAVVAAGPGKLMLDINGSTNENTEIDDSQTQYLFVDLKYGFCTLEKAKMNITIMPRVRVFVDFLSAKTAQEYWPELIFIGKF